MTESFTQTPEGYIRGRACVTNIGVFPYKLSDGSIEYELRHPDDVFENESLDSLRLKPVTNNHPSEAVTADNIKLFQVGNLGDNPMNGDNIHLTIDMIIQDAQTIDDVLRGKRELSCGYTADVVDESGVWLGMPYTKRQKNIRYNHVAVVDVARAGEAARIKLDSGDGILIRSFSDDAALAVEDTNSNKEGRMADNMKTIQLDSVDYEAEPAVIDAYLKEKSRADSLENTVQAKEGEIAKLEAERDSAKEKLDSVEQKLAELEASHLDEAEINKRVQARIELMALANDAKAEVKVDMSDMDIKKAIVLAVYPKTSLDGKSDEYINARVDCAREDVALEKEKNDTANVNEGNLPTTKVDGVDSAKEAYNRMVERLNSQGRK